MSPCFSPRGPSPSLVISVCTRLVLTVISSLTRSDKKYIYLFPLTPSTPKRQNLPKSFKKLPRHRQMFLAFGLVSQYLSQHILLILVREPSPVEMEPQQFNGR